MAETKALLFIFSFIGIMSLFSLLAAGDVPGLFGGQNRTVTEPRDVGACENISGTVDGINCAFDTGSQITGSVSSLINSPNSWFVFVVGFPMAIVLIWLAAKIIPGVG